MKTDIAHGDTTTLPEFNWGTWPGNLEGPQGVGKIYRDRFGRWIHETPRGWQQPVDSKYQGGALPPLTRTPKPVAVGKCGCGQYHHCGACGEQTWIEYHGVADGRCTYCHYAG